MNSNSLNLIPLSFDEILLILPMMSFAVGLLYIVTTSLIRILKPLEE